MTSDCIADNSFKQNKQYHDYYEIDTFLSFGTFVRNYAYNVMEITGMIPRNSAQNKVQNNLVLVCMYVFVWAQKHVQTYFKKAENDRFCHSTANKYESVCLLSNLVGQMRRVCLSIFASRSPLFYFI